MALPTTNNEDYMYTLHEILENHLSFSHTVNEVLDEDFDNIENTISFVEYGNETEN